ncbi:hypothetical protein [Thysanoplusia orichalcea nucleopolyhedrovirus]|uniref:Uncharacterized protein n=1 Tax=Thysanoplusia orichalcea nucleopolyhedrovirus TaxID=101850 RepID=L0CLM9_9ABAC|nr:hypothetical protein [Thysanoplusia orichalcea nucleopolyhedrovirus]AGA16166.1 hypothetical protein [Thysanoplusia orichalcea nucleopolyhedrovirus]
MSLAAKLIVYNYYGNYNAVHELHGEFHHEHRITQEYLTNSYTDGMSCIERDVIAVQRLKSGNSFDDTIKIINDDASVSIKSLSRWFSFGETVGVNDDVCRVLDQIDAAIPVNVRAKAGQQIFFLDNFKDQIDCHISDCLQIILGRFEHFMRNGKLLRLANVFNPNKDAVVGWWYNKFCVLTYVHRIMNNSVPTELLPRLSEAIKKFIFLNAKHQVDESDNCAHVITQIYGRFCGIGKEHFKQHKSSCMHILFQYMRDKITHKEEKFPCYKIIKDFGRQCKNVYKELKETIDHLHAYSVSDKDKNMLMDLLCVMNSEELDIDCFYFTFELFLNK